MNEKVRPCHEAFKVPFVMRKMEDTGGDRRRLEARILGFRETIFTREHSAVGEAMAGSEWTFGTIFQRSLDFLGVRMHYGHPDFMDGFWASNRGSTSKASPSLNVSEDMCAGLNLWLRKERSKHSDLLEWEKGREVDFIASSVFFAKISAGASSFLRTRDIFLICENMSLFRQMSFFYGSAGFFLNNAVVDISVMIYVCIFLCLALASVSIADLTVLNSPLAGHVTIHATKVTRLNSSVSSLSPHNS